MIVYAVIDYDYVVKIFAKKEDADKLVAEHNTAEGRDKWTDTFYCEEYEVQE